MEDIFFTLTFKQILLGLTIVIYAFVLTAILIKLLYKSNELDELPENDLSDVEQIFGVHTFNQNQEEDNSQDDDFQEVDVDDEDLNDYSSMMEDLTKNIMEEPDDDSDDPD